eukprot:jgi/Chrpa1/26100/Chrysochromulina_OHIO_Genome00026836-RA
MPTVRQNGKEPDRLRGTTQVHHGLYKGFKLLRYFKCASRHKGPRAGKEEYVWYMSEEDRIKFPMIRDVETPRHKDGQPNSHKIALKEELLFKGKLICATCGLKYDHTIASSTCFKIDSTNDAETSASAPNSFKFLKQKLERGAAQILCLPCEHEKSYRAPAGAQGNTRRFRSL